MILEWGHLLDDVTASFFLLFLSNHIPPLMPSLFTEQEKSKVLIPLFWQLARAWNLLMQSDYGWFHGLRALWNFTWGLSTVSSERLSERTMQEISGIVWWYSAQLFKIKMANFCYWCCWRVIFLVSASLQQISRFFFVYLHQTSENLLCVLN